MSAGDVFKMSVREVPLALHVGQFVVLRTLDWDVLGGFQDVDRGRPQDIRQRHSLTLHRGPYVASIERLFGDILRTSSGRNFVECGVYIQT